MSNGAGAVQRGAAWLRSRSAAVSVAVLALLAYVPALTAAPGRMPADSKLYIYLNPGRFLADNVSSFDPRQFAGWVPHQHISYLWPAGPWFWMFEQLRVPDWIAHRLWIGTLLLVAGLGVRWMARIIGLTVTAALIAAFVYQLSPYILPYVSRTSVLLLPWAGLGWIVGLTVLAARRGRWRFPAAIALVVFTVGAVNATALAMVIPAPVLWLVHAVWNRDITWRRAVATAARTAALCLAVSLWWMTMLVIQGRSGADVLAYSESLASVSFTSTSTEVARGLGYWLFYIRDSYAATTAASLDYLISLRIIAIGVALLGVCLAGLIATTWVHRRYAALLVAAGVVLGVGVHPIDDPSPVMNLLVGDGEGGLALALRSSTRAVPVMLLGLALGAGALVASTQRISIPLRGGSMRHRVRVGTVVAIVVAALAVLNLPALRTGGFVDPALERDQDPPQAWLDATARLDDLPDGYRVLQLPGGEFGAYQWGYTVDQPLPALTERPVLTRDLLPLGSPAAMDLVFALDDRFQDGTVDVAAIAPIARLLGADTIWVVNDISYDRFRLPRPEVVDDLLTGDGAADAGLLAPERFGTPAPMGTAVEMIDEQALGDSRIGRALSPVALVGIDDPVPTVRVKDTTIVLSGSGDGIVDAAAAGLIDGTELILYSASLDAAELATALDGAAGLIVTDSNRDRGHHWRSSQDVNGFTETGGSEPGVLEFESGDQRLAVFDSTDPDTQTIAVQVGPVTAEASSYGELFAYLPEHRAVMAIDGNDATSWVVADRAPANDEYIRLEVAEPVDHITLRQPDTPAGARSIAQIRVDIDGRDPIEVTLDERSLTGNGQRIEFDATDSPTTITITIVSTSDPQPPIGDAIGAVGFSTIDLGLEPTLEVVRPPIDATSTLDVGSDVPVSLAFTRLRTDPTDRWRSDPEAVMTRGFDLPVDQAFTTEITLRLDRRLDSDRLAELLDEPVVDNGHLTGVPTARGAAAFDGDPATSWVTPFGRSLGSALTLNDTGTAGTLGITQPDGSFSTVTALRVTDPAGTLDVAVAPGAGTISIDLPRPVDLSALTIEIAAVDERTTVDRRFGEPIGLPAAISELTFDERSPAITPSPTLEATCRDDLITLDGRAVAVSFSTPTGEALQGAAIEATACDPLIALAAGEHLLNTETGAISGFDVDQFAFVEPNGPGLASTDDTSIDPTVTVVTQSDRLHRTVEVPACPSGCWLVLGEGYNPAWSASADGDDLGSPRLVDGNANGWWIEPSTSPTTVEISWTAQRPLTLALGASLVGVLVMIALIVFDRRRDDDLDVLDELPRFDPIGRAWPRRSGLATAATTIIGAGLLIGWPWMLAAAVANIAPMVLRRSRLLGWTGLVLTLTVGAIVTFVVREERPFPGAGWPVRFEWLHGWTLLAILLIAGATLFADDARRRAP